MPARDGPIAASTGACDAHSATVTTLALGNATGSPPSALPGNPKNAPFAGVSGTSHSIPSMLISRQRPRNAPGVATSATGRATCENSPAIGSGPSRCRAWAIPPDVGTRPQDSSHPSQSASVPASRAATSS